MQSQAPLAPYVGLWTRLQDFAPEELTALTDQRQVARLNLMRTPCIWSAHATAWTCARCSTHCTPPSSARTFATASRGVARDALLTQAKRLLAEQPRTRGELGKLPRRCAVRHQQVPPPPGPGSEVP
jgi:hypothetical protein